MMNHLKCLLQVLSGAIFLQMPLGHDTQQRPKASWVPSLI